MNYRDEILQKNLTTENVEYLLHETIYGFSNLIQPIIDFFDNENLGLEIWSFLQFKNFDINELYLTIDNDEQYNLIHLLCAKSHEPIELRYIWKKSPWSFDFKFEFIEKLISSPLVNVNAQTSKGKTPLMVCHDFKYFTLFLKQNDLDVNVINSLGHTILTKLCAWYRGANQINFGELCLQKSHFITKIIDPLLLEAKNLDINYQNSLNQNKTALIYLTQEKCANLNCIQSLLNHKNIDINLCDDYNMNASLYAIKNHRYDILKLLINRKDFRINKEEQNVILLKACKHGQMEIVKSLIQLHRNQIDFNFKNNNGINALHYALKKHFLKITKLLLNESKININEKIENQEPIVLALWAYEKSLKVENMEGYHLEVIDSFLKRKDLNFSDVQFWIQRAKNKQNLNILQIFEKYQLYPCRKKRKLEN